MLSRLRPRSIYDVMAAIACLVALAGGTAYAANTILTDRSCSSLLYKSIG
jgi:hypothetical protein